MAATIKDIAKRLNISVSTVSYALNGGPRQVPPAVRDRVMEVARELSYRPNSIARSMVTRRTYTLGVVPTERSVNLAVTPYFAGLMNGVFNEAERQRQDVLIFTRYDFHEAERMTSMILDGRVDGVMFVAPMINTPMVRAIEAAKLPTVVISQADATLPSLTLDNAHGIATAVRHLASLGHRRIGHVAGKQNIDDGIERKQAFEACMAELGLDAPAEMIADGDFTQDGGELAFETLMGLPNPPTAIVCANDDSAVGCYRAARRLGIRVPEEVSLTGFDNSAISLLLAPQLTTLRQPLEEMGETAVRLLVDFVEGREVASQRFEPELIVRESTTCPLEDIRKS